MTKQKLINELTLENFKVWVESLPSDAMFNYISNTDCIIASFCKTFLRENQSIMVTPGEITVYNSPKYAGKSFSIYFGGRDGIPWMKKLDEFWGHDPVKWDYSKRDIQRAIEAQFSALKTAIELYEKN